MKPAAPPAASGAVQGGASAATGNAGGLLELASGPAALAIFVWGASFVATRKALAGFPPATLVAARFAIGALFVAGLQLARRRPVLPERADFGRCVVLGLLLSIHIGVQAVALRYTSATHSGWLVSFSPVAIALGAALFLRERIAASAWFGIAVASSGVALVVLSRSHGLEHARAGDLFVLSTCLTWSAYTLLSRSALARSGAWRVTPLCMAVAALVSGLVALGEPRTEFVPDTRAWAALLFLGLGSSGIGFTAWASAIERHGATRAGVLLYFQPFVTLVLSWLLLGETIDALSIAGGALVLLGVAGVARKRS